MSKSTSKPSNTTNLSSSAKLTNLSRLTNKPIFIFLFIVLVVGAVAGLTFYLTRPVNTTLTPDEEVKKTVAAVSKLMLLPTDETPTVAGVADVTKLAGQPFFARALNGDKVLIYNNKKQAILYRPSINLIIEVAPITVVATTPTPAQASVSASAKTKLVSTTVSPNEKSITFAIFNGTKVSGLAKTYEPVLQKAIPRAVVVDRGNTKNDYTQSLIVDLKGDNSSLVSEYARDLDMTAGQLPSGEIVLTKADFLIILGIDKTATPSASPTP